jgi:hypothetical protein
LALMSIATLQPAASASAAPSGPSGAALGFSFFIDTMCGRDIVEFRRSRNLWNSAKNKRSGNAACIAFDVSDYSPQLMRRINSPLWRAFNFGKNKLDARVYDVEELKASDPARYETFMAWARAKGKNPAAIGRILYVVAHSHPAQPGPAWPDPPQRGKAGLHSEEKAALPLLKVPLVLRELQEWDPSEPVEVALKRAEKKYKRAKKAGEVDPDGRVLGGGSEQATCASKCHPLVGDLDSAVPHSAKGNSANVDTLRDYHARVQRQLAQAASEQASLFGDEQASNGLARALAASTSESGGIDFTSLELRYLRESGSRIQYAFKAPTIPEGADASTLAGIVRAQEASDAFFVWLALSPDKFWVNLNPNEPNRIVDATFGRTDAGKALLEADLEMKRTVGRLIHPDTRLGARYWNEVRGTCFSSRQWIVPAPATVRETRDELYILDAPLSVRMETDYVQDRGTGKYRSCPHASKATEEHNEAVYRRLILPRVEKAVNTAPEYAALRRVYLSRVAAEWYRQRSAEVPTAFSTLIDNGKITPWMTASDWKPVDTFRAYVRSFTDGEFNITRKTRRGDYIEKRTYVYGGVDFSNVAYDNVARADFHARWPGLSDTIKSGLHEASRDRRTHDTWLGGTSVADPERAVEASRPTSRASERADTTSLPVASLALVAGAALMLVAIVLMLRKR